MRCVEVDLGPIPSGIQELNRMIHRALCLQGTGLEWTYGETRPSDSAFRIAFYRYVESEAEFAEALKTLRFWLGDDGAAREIECVSAYDETMALDE